MFSQNPGPRNQPHLNYLLPIFPIAQQLSFSLVRTNNKWPNFSEIQASGESCNFEKSAVFKKNRFALGNFSSQSEEIEVVLVVCLLRKEKKMASRVSAVREVLGLPAEDSLLLAQHDEEFFEEAEVAESSSSRSDDDLISDRSASGASDDSEQEENLDSVDLADRSTGSLADSSG